MTANNLNFTFNYRIKIRAHLEKSFKRKHKRSGMYYACVRNTVLCCMNAPQATESRSHAKHLFCMVYISVEIDKRQSRMGIVNYVHNLQNYRILNRLEIDKDSMQLQYIDLSSFLFYYQNSILILILILIKSIFSLCG